MTSLLIGDPHNTVEDLDDCGALMKLAYNTALEQKVNEIIILGDLHHNFSLTNVKVMAFWRQYLSALKFIPTLQEIILIVGNHDMPGDGARYPHALLAYEDLATVIDKPTMLDGHRLFIPYISEPNLFIEIIEEHPEAKLIYCHQEFNGAIWDNGFYSPNGVDPTVLKCPVISGHIHTPQRITKSGGEECDIWYVGAPRWRTLSDANLDRSIVIVDDLGRKLNSFDTSQACRKIWRWDVTPETPDFSNGPLAGNPEKDEYRIHVSGPAAFVKEHQEWPLKHYRVSSTITDDRVIRVRESDGIEVAFQKFVKGYSSKNGFTSEQIMEAALGRVNETVNR